MDTNYNIFMGFDDTASQRFAANLEMKHLKIHKRIEEMGMAHQCADRLRNLTIIIPYPIAHIQDQDMLLNRWDDLEMRQRHLPELVMAGLTKEGKKDLAKLGWNLERIIVFDGFPQFFPTPTSGYYEYGTGNTNANKGEESFIQHGGYPQKGEHYPAWIPEHGHACRGPVPLSSKLTNASRLSRDAFQDLGLDMNFYIRSWEFSNQFWWMAQGWTRGGGLDCTHGVGVFYDAHRYLLQAAIDDHYDTKH